MHPNQTACRTISERLGQLYKHAKLLKRLQSLLEQAEKSGLPLNLAIQIPPSTAKAGHEGAARD